MTHTLSSYAVETDLGTRRIGREVLCVDSAPSTSDVALEKAEAGSGEGLVVVAEEQTAGRGRHGRAWHSPRGGLWCSVLLRSELPAEHRPFLTVLGAVALARAVESVAGVATTIRWPNDLMCGDRKLAGVLVEVRDGPTGPLAVIGIGCNVDHVPSGLPPEIATASTALALEAGRSIDRVDLLRTLCRELDTGWGELLAGETAMLDGEWRDRSGVLGRRVRVTVADSVSEGTVTAIGAADGVTLRTDDGAERSYRSEHITRLELV